MKKLFASLVLSSAMFGAAAQTAVDGSALNTWSIGLDVGPAIMTGDLRGFRVESDVDGKSLGFGLNAYGTKWLSPKFALQLGLGYYNLTGKNGNLYFKSSYFEYKGHILFNLSEIILPPSTEQRKWSFILDAFAGLSHSNPTLYDINDVELGGGSTSEGYYGAGLLVKRSLNTKWDLDFRFQARNWLDDQMDGFRSGDYPDGMGYVGVGVTYYFGPKDAKPITSYNPLNDLYNNMQEVKKEVDVMKKDDDGDGVSNYFDKDANTPEGVVVDGSGRAMDTDGDGIADHMDADPYTSRGAKVDAQGREVDTDGDGVPDSQDMDNNTPKGAMVNFQGKEIQGGLGDAANALLPTIYFSTNSATVSSANAERLAVIARMMKANPNMKLKVVGNTDKTGSEQYNMNLGMRRATAVVKELEQSFGIDASRLTAESAGETNAVSGKNLKVNRRVEFIIE